MEQIILVVGGYPISVAEAALAAAGLVALVLAVVLFRSLRQGRAEAARAGELETRLGEIQKSQGEMTGRVETMAQILSSRQADLARNLSERLDGLSHRLGQSVSESARHTETSLSRLNERLAVIDTAQRNITALSTEVVGLQAILANKQTRGAFGQGRMEAIIKDGLPFGWYEFQATLSNRNRPDCLIALPNGSPGLVVDAKFPLEAWNALRSAPTPEATKVAQTRFRRDMQTHLQAIADRYFIPGETHDTAFMFVPSESIFADVHEHFEDVIQHAHRWRVVIVSPSLLMLSIQVIQALLKDARMREQAHLIRDEVFKLMEDIRRLDERVDGLRIHFGQAAKDIDQISTSSQKISRRSERIEAMEFEHPARIEEREAAHREQREPSRQPDLLERAEGELADIVTIRARVP